MPRLAKQKLPRDERGIALIMVLSLVALVATVVSDFQYNSRVSYQLAINARDELQAEYNAISAMRMRALLLKQSGKLNSQRSLIASAIGIDVNMIPPIGQLVEMVPVECGLLSTIMKTPDASTDSKSEALEEEGLLNGECMATSSSEHAKISVNMLRNQLNNSSKNITKLLLGLLSEPRLEKHFQEDDRNGTHADNPEELVGALIDWTDNDNNQSGNQVSDEDRFYAYLKDSYKVKNAPFDSLEEVQLVHGMDDDLFNMLKDHLSIYTDGTQMELATAPTDRIVLLGLPAAMHEGFVPEQLWMHPRFAEFYVALSELKQMGGMGFGILNVKVLTGLIAQFELQSVVNVQAISKVFTDKPSTTWYTIKAEGTVGYASRRLKGVFQASEGKFYYMRVE